MDHTHQVDESRDEPNPLEALGPQMPKSVHRIRVQVEGEVLDPGTPKFNDVAKIIGQITIYFS